MRVQRTLVGEFGDGRGDGRMHAAAGREEVAEVGRQHVVAVADPAEG
jgi:hypothetical protein